MRYPFKLSLLTVAIANSFVAPLASAQDQSSNDFRLEEVVVTAQRRSENRQDVPIAISAISGDSLQEKGLSDVSSIGSITPNATIKNTASFGGSSSILVSYIRGIGQNDFAFNLEPGVGIYVDGVYLARNIGANVDLLDIQNIEVLKGPQGTLFGRNSIGGALNIVTRDPGNEFKSKVEFTTGSYSRADFRAMFDIPLVDNELALGIALSKKDRDGWQKRVAYNGDTANNPIYLMATGGAFGGPVNTNSPESTSFPLTDGQSASRSGDQDAITLRSKLVWTPNDRFAARLIADYQKVDQQAAPFSLLRVDQNAYVAVYNTCITGDPAVYAGVGALTGFGTGIANICNASRGNPASPTGEIASLGSEAGQHLPYDNRYVIRDSSGRIDPDRSYAKGSNFDKLDVWGINLNWDYSLTDDVVLKSITGYRELDSSFGVDIGGAPFLALSPTFSDDEQQFSQEIQLSGLAWDARWNYLVGAYYFHEEGLHTDGVPFVSGLLQVWSPDNEYDTKAYAIFAHNNIQLTDDFGVTFGIRYTEEDKSFTGAQRDENAFAAKLFGLPASSYPGGDIYQLYPLDNNELDFDDISYRIGAEYRFSDDVMGYTSFATGYKGGGWTTRLLTPALDAPTFEPEEAETFEVGMKSELLGGRVRLNGAVFYTQYDDIQLTFQDGPSPVTANGGDGIIKGFEIELESLITANWSVDASLGYLKAEYDTVRSGVLLNGDEDFVNTPERTAHIGSSYQIYTDVGTFAPRLDVMYQSEVYNDEANTEDLATPGYSMINASLLYSLPNQDWQIQMGVTNVADKRVIASGYTNAEAIYAATYNRPREWFVTFRAAF
ncbi:TonB-dependent receptor [Zhongshania sp. BJYM1]|uniref:TonB-dependent receptor n=1 Tax=Zhongshania aquatica TaxID=2965069 RepID=UPI0022B47CC6|nr:TonB-dependent receptor [Marortus sp. BJYM1]